MSDPVARLNAALEGRYACPIRNGRSNGYLLLCCTITMPMSTLRRKPGSGSVSRLPEREDGHLRTMGVAVSLLWRTRFEVAMVLA